MEMEDDTISTCEEVVSTAKIMNKRRVKRSKKPNSKFYKYLLECLNEEPARHQHMLKYITNSKNEFEVIFTDRKNKKIWKRSDISLFVDCDKYLGSKFNRKRSEVNYEENVKIRFKSNMWKCEGKFIEKISERKIGKSKTIKTYRILWRPQSVGESSNAGKNDGKKKRKSKKNDKSNDNKEMDVKEITKNALSDLEDDPLKSSQEIIYFLNKPEDDKSKIVLKDICDFQETQKNYSHYSCLPANSQDPQKIDSQSILDCLYNLEIDGVVPMDYKANLQNLKIVPSAEVNNSADCLYNLEIDGIVHMDYKANLENLKILPSAEDSQKIDSQSTLNYHDNMEIDGNVHADHETDLENLKFSNVRVDHEADLENLKISNVRVDHEADLENLKFLNVRVYHEADLENLKILNSADINNAANVNTVSSGDVNDLLKVTTNTFYENFGNHMNISDGNLYCDPNFIIDGYVSSQDLNYYNVETKTFSKNLDAYIATEYDGGENYISNGKYLIDEIESKQNVENEKFMCSLPFWAVSNSLGDYNDWSNNYQNLKNMEPNVEN